MLVSFFILAAAVALGVFVGASACVGLVLLLILRGGGLPK